MKDPWYIRLAKKLWKFQPHKTKVLHDRFTDQPYLVRYTILDIYLFKVFLHQFIRRDFEAKFHNHPWPFYHRILQGSYNESNEQGYHIRNKGYQAFHWNSYRHSIVEISHSVDAWSLVIRGPKLWSWGFHCDEGFVRHDDYEKRRNANLGWEC